MEQNYVIAVASTCDLTRDYLEEHNIPFVSYSYVLNDEVFSDDCTEETRQNIYKQMREGAILSTSAINEFTYEEFFENIIKDGKDIIFLDMSRPLSSSYRFCDEAISELKESYPERTVVNVDTCCVSGGLGMLVKDVVKLYEAGKSMQEVLDYIEKTKLTIAHRFTVDDLKWLKLGGRVSNASALVGTLLSIKPVLYVQDDGALVAATKVRGRKNALNSVIESIKKDVPTDNYFVINHADCIEDANYLKEKILENYPDAQVDISGLGVVIGAHCGPGLLTVFFKTAKRNA